MGEIYLARLEGAQGFEKLCVIKKILPQLAADKDFVDRFVGEARMLVKLSHGSIAQVLDMGLHEGDAYMALEYVDGKDLRKVAGRVRDRQMPLPLTFILYVMGRVLDALAYAHRKRDDDEKEILLVHRDISPQNILISYEGEVKVIDFGLAKSRLSAAKTNPSIILGKFLYMSPEQARHQPVDRRSDLYAVGLCLYELISGQNPFDSVPPGELMPMVASPRITPLSEVEPLTPPAVAQLVMKALAVEPAQRFQSAEEFRSRLQSCLHEIDPNAGPESVSRFMRDLFSTEFQGERKLLAQLKDAARVSEQVGRPSVTTDPMARLPNPALPPRTIKLDGPVEPLSFHPTPRSRDGRPMDDGDTRPGIPVDESTHPGASVVAPEPISRSRARATLGSSPTAETASIEVNPEQLERTGPMVPAPAPTRSEATTLEVPIPVVPAAAIPPARAHPAPTVQPPTLLPGPESVTTSSAAPADPAALLPLLPALVPPPAESTDPHGVPPPPLEPPRPAPLHGEPAPSSRESVRGSGQRAVLPERGSARSSEPSLSLAEEMAAVAAAAANRRGLDDTHPSYKVKGDSPAPHDTQPGVVVDDSALNEMEAMEEGEVIVGGLLEEDDEPTPPPTPSKPTRRARVSGTGMPAIGRAVPFGRSGGGRAFEDTLPPSSGLEPFSPEPETGEADVDVDVDVDLSSRDPNDNTRREAIPTRPGDPGRRIHREDTGDEQEPAPAPKRSSWVGLLVTVVLLAVVGGALAVTYPSLKLVLEQQFGSKPVAKPPPAVPLGPARPVEPVGSAAPPPAPEPAPASTPAAASVETAPAAPSGAPVEAAPSGAPAEAAPSGGPAEAAPSEVAEAPPAEAENLPAPEAAREEEPDMLVPLTSPPAQPTAKKPPVRPLKKVGRRESELQKEWSQTSRAFIKLTEVQSCESPKVGILCKRYESLQNDVEAAGEANAREVQGRVRKLRSDIQKAMNAVQ